MSNKTIVGMLVAVVVVIVLILVIAGGKKTAQAPATTDTAESTEMVTTPPTQQSANQKPSRMNQNSLPVAVMTTNMGVIRIELFSDRAVKTVENFRKLAGEGFYNGTRFHRIIAGFMVQGGDPLSKDSAMSARWGTGGPGYTFADEIYAGNSNDVGTIAMANAGPNTNGSQFFINVANNSFLNGKHTVFGRVIDGMDVVEKMAAVQTDANDRPVADVIIESVGIQQQ